MGLDRNQLGSNALRISLRLAAIGVCLSLGLAWPSSVSAQSRVSRVMRAVKIDRTATGWVLDLEFEVAVRYLKHTPRTPSRSLIIQIDPLDLGASAAGQGPIRENLPIPRGEPIPLVEIEYDSSGRGNAVVELLFSQSLEFEVEQGRNARSLRIRAEVPRTSAKRPEDGSRATQLLVRARHSIRDGDLALAIALLTRILELPKPDASEKNRMDARELIALTHERLGQLAHAQAEYEAYLIDYPDGPAALRVRQRLDALETASAAPRDALRSSSRSGARGGALATIDREVFGSAAARYFRSETLSDNSGGDFLATNVLTDFDIAGRLDADSWSLRGDFTGTYDLDVAGEGRSDEVRFSRLSVQFEDRVRRVEATLGRQRRSDAGVLDRFDGLRVAAEVGSHYAISALVGLPVESTTNAKPDTDTIVAGGALDIKDLWLEGLESQFFVVGRRTASLTDRAAIGSEIRYAGEKTYSFVYLDYDVAFGSLNTFLASSSYRWSPDTDFRVLIERRNSPILTMQTALQGQTTVTTLTRLKQHRSNKRIRELAQNRTSVSWSGTIGATHRPNTRYQISTDLTVSLLGKTKDSDVIADPAPDPDPISGFPAIGPDFSGSIQLIVNDWLIEDGIGSLSIRYFEGDAFRSAVATAYSRFRLPHDIRLLPRIRWEIRDSENQGSQSSLRPSLEANWRYEALLFDAEVGLDWDEPISGSGAFRQTSYFVELGIRWEF